ncbi:metallophosphoesterase [Chitinophaga sp. 30R24]|uniref:metallophosphoesterase n=1 Tax=Chitinophaga sp. 30R24 TaxID=3248838 RepID=UPI003B8F900B
MHIARRAFLRNTSMATGLLFLQQPFRMLAAVSNNATYIPGNNRELFVRHSNDLHGQPLRLQPGEQGLLVDAGDFTDGSTNVAAHREMIAAMNHAGYHAATIGNRELANGQAALSALIPDMQFALVNCNYRFSDKALAQQVQPYKIVYAGRLKIGITGVGPQLPASSGVTYLSPVEAVNKVAANLKKQQGCQVVICLSHLGYQQSGTDVNNYHIATHSSHIDSIIGGHQHEFLQGTMVLRNALNHEVYLSHAGGNGQMIGKTQMLFNDDLQGCGVLPSMMEV